MPQTSVPTAMTAAFDGMIVDSEPFVERSYVSEEASAEIPFGVCVKQGTGDNGALKLTSTADKLIGLVRHSHAYNRDNELGSTGLKPYVTLGVVTKGVMWVPVEEAVTPASAVLVRAVATGNEVAGAFRDTADGSDCIDVSAFCRYLSSTTGAGRAKLAFDFTMRNADPVD